MLSTLNNSSSRIGEAISIDEFKGNVGIEKYQSIIVDPIKHKVLNVLYSRKSTCLVEYHKSIDKSRRMKVKFFSYDMNKTFIDMAKVYFPNAKIVIDKYTGLLKTLEREFKRIWLLHLGSITNVVRA